MIIGTVSARTDMVLLPKRSAPQLLHHMRAMATNPRVLPATLMEVLSILKASSLRSSLLQVARTTKVPPRRLPVSLRRVKNLFVTASMLLATGIA